MKINLENGHIVEVDTGHRIINISSDDNAGMPKSKRTDGLTLMQAVAFHAALGEAIRDIRKKSLNR